MSVAGFAGWREGYDIASRLRAIVVGCVVGRESGPIPEPLESAMHFGHAEHLLDVQGGLAQPIDELLPLLPGQLTGLDADPPLGRLGGRPRTTAIRVHG